MSEIVSQFICFLTLCNPTRPSKREWDSKAMVNARLGVSLGGKFACTQELQYGTIQYTILDVQWVDINYCAFHFCLYTIFKWAYMCLYHITTTNLEIAPYRGLGLYLLKSTSIIFYVGDLFLLPSNITKILGGWLLNVLFALCLKYSILWVKYFHWGGILTFSNRTFKVQSHDARVHPIHIWKVLLLFLAMQIHFNLNRKICLGIQSTVIGSLFRVSEQNYHCNGLAEG